MRIISVYPDAYGRSGLCGLLAVVVLAEIYVP